MMFNKLLVLLMLIITISLSGCKSKVNYETYMEEYVKVNNIELDVEILNYNVIRQREYSSRLVKITYYEYFDKYSFKPKTVYAVCVYDDCDFISESKYIERRNNNE